ncbi:MAG: hypothetical protein H6713_34635 [Myxococcales bacterium]|nr:hypothetical protein [Myxococcales bacterium]
MTRLDSSVHFYSLRVAAVSLAIALGGCGDDTSETTAGTTNDTTGEETTEGGTTAAPATTDPTNDTSSGASSSTGDPEPVCGDGVLDDGEACDGDELNGADCVSEGFVDGALSCGNDCALDTSKCVTELMCSEGALAAPDCTVGDAASCACVGCDNNGMCTLEDDCVCGDCGNDAFCSDPANCNNDGQCDPYNEGCGCQDCSGHPQCYPICGDGVAAADEACDGEDLAGSSCVAEGFDGGGVLACDDACGLVTDECLSEEVCGDTFIGATEACDGENLAGEDCVSQGFADGELACADSCEFDTSGCFDVCGDEAITGLEECDGVDLGGESCVSQGFPGGGLLLCGIESCLLDTSGCLEDEVCGDGYIGETETCDGEEFGGETCVSQGFPGGGPLSCEDECALINTEACVMDEVCGDGFAGESEECDGDDLAGEDCISQGFPGGGVLSCNDACEFITEACL